MRKLVVIVDPHIKVTDEQIIKRYNKKFGDFVEEELDEKTPFDHSEDLEEGIKETSGAPKMFDKFQKNEKKD